LIHVLLDLLTTFPYEAQETQNQFVMIEVTGGGGGGGRKKMPLNSQQESSTLNGNLARPAFKTIKFLLKVFSKNSRTQV